MSTFHGLPIVEADAAVYLRALESDGGERGDPLTCRFACAARRAFGGLAAFFKTVAYIELEPGTITRFATSPEARAAVEAFDATGVMPSGTFKFIPGAETLVARSERNKNGRNGKTLRGDRAPRTKATGESGTGNGHIPMHTARGGYVPLLHR